MQSGFLPPCLHQALSPPQRRRSAVRSSGQSHGHDVGGGGGSDFLPPRFMPSAKAGMPALSRAMSTTNADTRETMHRMLGPQSAVAYDMQATDDVL